MSMKLLGNRLHVKPVASQDRTLSGLFLPQGSGDELNLGSVKCFDVLGVGSGSKYPVEALTGDRVLCQSYTHGPLPLPDGTAIIDENLVLAIIPRDKRYELQTPVP
jgi:co-chaperonin GroES (HSP10)